MVSLPNRRAARVVALIGMIVLCPSRPLPAEEVLPPFGLEPQSPAAEAAPPQDTLIPLTPEPQPQPELASTLASRGPIARLAGLPNMFGDSYGCQLQVCDFAFCRLVDIPPPGGTRRVKISENDKALPTDRIFFSYYHFQNAIEANVPGVGVDSFPIDQYTMGVEKTFCCRGLWSLEARLPFSRTPQIAAADVQIGNGDVGNLTLTLKRLLFATQTTAVGVGLPVELPTGSDVSGTGIANSFSLSNDAAHLAPFIGFLTAPNDCVFYQGFLQVDVAANGNRVYFGGNELGTLDEQTLLYVDLGMGRWLCRDRCSRTPRGLAWVLEYHYTTTLNDADMVGGTDGRQYLRFGNLCNRMDASNLTVGLHAQLGCTTVRVGGAFPLSTGSDRLYDAELQVSVNRRF